MENFYNTEGVKMFVKNREKGVIYYNNNSFLFNKRVARVENL